MINRVIPRRVRDLTPIDAVFIGDGSGSTRERACAWAVVIIEHDLITRHVLTGGMNLGTVNTAELMAYVHAISWYLHPEKIDELRDLFNRDDLHVHIITDSDYAAQLGANRAYASSHANHIYWAAIEAMQRKGVMTHWHHCRGDSVGLNVYADRLAYTTRMCLQSGDPVSAAETITRRGIPGPVHDINPNPIQEES